MSFRFFRSLALLALAAGTAPASDDKFVTLRMQMVEEQLMAPGRDIRNPRVLQAMRTVPRHLLVPEDVRDRAYGDHPLPIGYGQTISQPYIVALMTELLDPQPGDRILEIGTGSGYQAAVLAELVKEVYSIEIVEPLARRAKEDLRSLGYRNIRLRTGDGYLGWPEAAPFDAIIVTCAPENIPQQLVEQLREGGKMVIPVGVGTQELVLLQKQGGKVHRRNVLPVRFVPMVHPAPGESAQKSE